MGKKFGYAILILPWILIGLSSFLVLKFLEWMYKQEFSLIIVIIGILVFINLVFLAMFYIFIIELGLREIEMVK